MKADAIKPRIVASVEARMTSTRLPGKVLMPAGGKPLLQILIERLRRARHVDDIIVATTINQEDEPIVAMCRNLNISFFRGSEKDVLARVCGAAEQAGADVLVEITGDCPFVDPALADEAIEIFLSKFPESRYVSNSGPNISMPWGFDVQVFLASDLINVNNSSPDELDKEHVSYRFYRPETRAAYNPHFIQYQGELNRPELRVTLDYPADYELIRAAYEDLVLQSPAFTAIEVIRWLDAHPQLRDAAIACRPPA